MKTTANPLDSQSQTGRCFSGVCNKSGVAGSRICMQKSGVEKKKFSNYAALENKRVFIEAVLGRKASLDHLIKKNVQGPSNNVMDNFDFNLTGFQYADKNYNSISSEEDIKIMISNGEKVNKDNINYITTAYLKACVLPGFSFYKQADAELGMEKATPKTEEEIALDAIVNSDVSELAECIQITIKNEVDNFILTSSEVRRIESVADMMTEKFSDKNWEKLDEYIHEVKKNIKTEKILWSLYSRISSSFFRVGDPLYKFIFK